MKKSCQSLQGDSDFDCFRVVDSFFLGLGASRDGAGFFIALDATGFGALASSQHS